MQNKAAESTDDKFLVGRMKGNEGRSKRESGHQIEGHHDGHLYLWLGGVSSVPCGH